MKCGSSYFYHYYLCCPIDLLVRPLVLPKLILKLDPCCNSSQTKPNWVGLGFPYHRCSQSGLWYSKLCFLQPTRILHLSHCHDYCYYNLRRNFGVLYCSQSQHCLCNIWRNHLLLMRELVWWSWKQGFLFWSFVFSGLHWHSLVSYIDWLWDEIHYSWECLCLAIVFAS